MKRQRFEIEDEFGIEAAYLRKLCKREAAYIKKQKGQGKDVGAAEYRLRRLWMIADLLERAACDMNRAIESIEQRFARERWRLIENLKNAETRAETGEVFANANMEIIRMLLIET